MRARSHNAILAGEPPRYLHGLPTNSRWLYRGRHIDLVEHPSKRPHRWMATWEEDDDEGERSTGGRDGQAALYRARFKIDVIDIDAEQPGYEDAQDVVQRAISDLSEEPRVNRGTVARQLEEWRRSCTGSEMRQAWICEGLEAFYDLALSERLRLIDETLLYATISGWLDETRVFNATRQRNPLLRGHPPTYLQGLPSKSLWAYQGRSIEVEETRPGKWEARYRDADGDERKVHAEDAQGALYGARFGIDVEVLTETVDPAWGPAESAVEHVVDFHGDQGAVSRSKVARTLEEWRRGCVSPPAGVRTGRSAAALCEDIEAFYRLPLTDRLRLIDEVIHMQIVLGLIGPEIVSNPRGVPRKRQRSVVNLKRRCLRR